MKVLIAPDKFKGSLSSLEACNAIKEGLQHADKNIKTQIFPMADGGDGFAEVLKYYLHTTTIKVESVDPLGREIESAYEIDETDGIAIIELATCSGLAMLKKEERNPMITSTYGTGLQIQHAIEQGVNKIILGLGGSATNDAGMGVLTAMGFVFLNKSGEKLAARGENLLHVQKIIPPPALHSIQFEIACDVDNPLYGPEGAAYIFLPQKGATQKQVALLDEGLQNIANIIRQQTGKDVSTIPGAGAAGGIAAGLMAYLDVRLIPGINLVINSSGIKNSIADADAIITGEGKLDQQSFRGKTISAVTALGNERNIPVIAICGKLELSETAYKNLGLHYADEISDPSLTEEECMRRAAELLTQKATKIVEIITSTT